MSNIPKPPGSRLRQTEARAILTRCSVEPGSDFHALSSTQVDALLAEADKRGYRKPPNANGSRARYFHAYVERAARDRPFSGFVSRTDGRLEWLERVVQPGRNT